MATEKQIAANRRNAKKSTGPRTEIGKKLVSQNPRKHGILSKVIQTCEGKESKAEFEKLLQELQEYYQPIGIVEEAYLERIFICLCRLRRCIRHESGELVKSIYFANEDASSNIEQRFEFLKRISAFVESKSEMRTNSMALEFLWGILDKIKNEVKETGGISKETRTTLFQYFGKEKDRFADLCSYFLLLAKDGVEFAKKFPEKYGEPPDAEECRKSALMLIDLEMDVLLEEKETIVEKEETEKEMRLAALTLPPADVVDKILRYETTIERQLYRAMDRLEKVQRNRRGK